MAWLPIAQTVPQYEDLNGDPAVGYVLKFYANGTSDNIMLATDNTGGTQATDVVLNSRGEPEISAVTIIPHLEEGFKIVLYATQAAADSDSGAVWEIDNIINTDVAHLSGTEIFIGDKSFTGTFTTLGIDDNATSERLELTNTAMILGTSGASFNIYHPVDDRLMAVSGGNSSNDGGNIRLSGGTTAAGAGDIIFRSGTNNFFKWNEIAGTQQFLDGTGSKTQWLITDGSQVATFANPPLGLNVAAVTNHIRAGNTQIHDGDAVTARLTVSTDLTAATWETIGPTGSGADNIWTEMDIIPSNATILIVSLLITVSTSGTGQASIEVYAQEGDGTLAAGASNLIAQLQVDHDAAITGEDGTIAAGILIPLEPVNQDFRMQWITSLSSSSSVNMYYKGFMTD